MSAVAAVAGFAVREFLLPFKWLVVGLRRGPCPGGADFLFFTIVMTLILAMGGFVMMARNGLADGVVGIFLGEVEGHGIPLWVQSNVYDGPRFKLISSEVIDSIRPDHPVFPFREVVLSRPGEVFRLPETVWRGAEETGGNPLDPTTMSGVAVGTNDPLWGGRQFEGQAPLVIRVSRTEVRSPAFRRHFDLGAYRRALLAILPTSLVNRSLSALGAECVSELETLAPGPTPERCDLTRLNILWLVSRRILQDGGSESEPLPFAVEWVDQIRSTSHPIFLVPLQTYHLWRLVSNRADIRYYPEASPSDSSILAELRDLYAPSRPASGAPLPSPGSSGTFRVSQCALVRDADAASINAWKSKDMVQYQDGVSGIVPAMLSFSAPMPTWLLTAWLQAHPLPIGECTGSAPTAVTVSRDAIEITCFGRNAGAASGCTGPRRFPVAAADATGYDTVALYVQNRERLSSAVRDIESRHEFRLHEMYVEALHRFGFLTEIIDRFRIPLSVIFIGFSGLLTSVLINVLVSNRRTYYAVLRAKGFSGVQVGAVFCLQVAFATILAAAVTAVALQALSGYFSDVAHGLMARYITVLAVDKLVLLPFSDELFIAAAVALSFSLLVSVGSLILHGIVGVDRRSIARLLAR